MLQSARMCQCNSSAGPHIKASKASKITLCVQALSSMRGLRGLGVSQCSGVTGEALGQLLPSLPACTRLTLNCLHLTDDHMDMLVKVLPHATPSGFCAAFPAKKRKEKLTLFSDHNRSLLRRQPGANFPSLQLSSCFIVCLEAAYLLHLDIIVRVAWLTSQAACCCLFASM